jgi:uncharacterized protein
MTPTTGGRVRGPATRAVVQLIELYRNAVSPLRLPTCRFTPTCSQYAVDALLEYGFLRGSWLTIRRLARCGPWHRGGWDPIPERTAQQSAKCSCGDAGDGRSESYV